MTNRKPIFTTEAGTKISRLSNDRQLKKFLSRTWQQKSLRIDVAPGLSIHQTGRWHFDLMVNGKRLSTTLGRYPEVSLADARSKALRIRQGFVETGTRPKPKKIQPDKESGSHPPPTAAPMTRLTVCCLNISTIVITSFWNPRPTNTQTKQYWSWRHGTVSIWLLLLENCIQGNSTISLS